MAQYIHLIMSLRNLFVFDMSITLADGVAQLRKSRSAFAERLLCPSATPSAPVPTATGATSSSPSTLMMLPLSHSSSTSRILSTSSATSSPSCSATSSSFVAVFSLTKKAPAPPPRLQTTSPSCCDPTGNSSNRNLLVAGMTSAADLSLRSSSDSGFVNEPLQQQSQPPMQETTATPPPAPEVDYSDEDSLK